MIGCAKSFKVINFVTSEKPVCDFLFVDNINCGPVSQPFGRYSEACQKSLSFCTRVPFDAPTRGGK